MHRYHKFLQTFYTNICSFVPRKFGKAFIQKEQLMLCIVFINLDWVKHTGHRALGRDGAKKDTTPRPGEGVEGQESAGNQTQDSHNTE